MFMGLRALIPRPVWHPPEPLEVSALPENTIRVGLTAVGGIEHVQLDFIRDHAAEFMKTSPVDYIKGAKLRGSLFGHLDDVADGTVSSVDTNFYVDHTEPIEALERVRKNVEWPLGDLMEGHEFLLVLEANDSLGLRLGPSVALRIPRAEEAYYLDPVADPNGDLDKQFKVPPVS